MIHHVTLEVDKKQITWELQFWAFLGFNPTGLRRRSRKQPPIHWLVCGDESHAIELLPVDDPQTWGRGHLCYEIDQRRAQILAVHAAGLPMVKIERASDFFGNERRFLHSPSGHVVEVIYCNAVSIKAGPPLEEE